MSVLVTNQLQKGLANAILFYLEVAPKALPEGLVVLTPLLVGQLLKHLKGAAKQGRDK
jgi:hypothetical protein